MRRRAGLSAALAAVAALSQTACGDPAARVVVIVETDYAVPAELDQIRIEVDASATGTMGIVERTADLEGRAGELPVTLGLVHAGGALGPIDVTVTGRARGADLGVSQRARFSFVAGQTRALRMRLLRSCGGVECPAEQTCGVSGCGSITPPLEPWPPASPDGGGCGSESCNGLDDDCDGSTDEGFDTTTDPANCGACGTRCAGSESCEGGRCVATCPDGFGECDGDPSTPCETRLNTDSDCGACGRACVRFSGVTSCDDGTCRLLTCEPGFRDCNGVADDGCESNLSDNLNCGGCGIPCELFQAVEACREGTCSISSCEPGSDNCDGRDENGCESDVTGDVFHCGGCDRRCALSVPHASNVCVGGRCELACHPGWADCDGVPETGCETDLSLPATCGACDVRCTGTSFLCSGTTATGFACIPPPCESPPTRCGASCVDLNRNANHCGACDFTCPSRANSAPVCTDAACGFVCDAGYGDCDGDPTNGCETPLNLVVSCGTCGSACDLPQAVEACIGGACVVTACSAGWGDCNLDGSDGCERPTTTLTDCGGCDVPCDRANAIASCSTGACRIQACEPGWGNCDGIDANGCERSLAGCATCGGTCVFDHAAASCVADTCRLDACEAGWADCDGLLEDGCERSLTTLSDCGACGAPCNLERATETCDAGTCAVAACDAGWGDCDGTASNGCETELGLSDAHCGACGDACATTERCAAGVCRSENEVVQVAAGRRHTCALLAKGEVWCWGDNSFGQLGDGTFFDRPMAVAVSGISDAVEVVTGRGSSCARHATGAVSCWGDNGAGQLGTTPVGPSRPFPLLVPGVTNAVALSMYREFVCAALESGQVSCWGDNRSGNLGRGTGSPSEPPGLVAGIGDAVEVGTGRDHACAVRASGALACWGNNNDGQLGDGSTTDSTLPVASTATSVVEVVAGDKHTCARTSAGAVRCWGTNASGQLGDGSFVDSPAPVTVMSLADATQLGAGKQHVCAVRSTGAVACWGGNASGELGDGSTTTRGAPVTVVGLSAIQVAAGAGHSCAVTTGYEALCWGANGRGQLGDGSTDGSLTPVFVSGLP